MITDRIYIHFFLDMTPHRLVNNVLVYQSLNLYQHRCENLSSSKEIYY
jgi:hypothetical protein